MGATIYDIADKAGVSIATVSRVFNGSSRVADSTRKAVLKAAEEIGYQPHVSARSLARRRSDTVSAVIPMMTTLFFTEVLRGLQDRMARSEFDLLVFSARTLEEVAPQLQRALHRGRSAGVLLFSAPVVNRVREQLSKSEQAIVLVDSFHPDFDSISTDNRRGGEIATRYLADLGCQRIAMIMANPESRPAVDRRAGYEVALGRAGLRLDENLIVSSRNPLHHGYSEASGLEAMDTLLRRDTLPEGVFVTSDIQALGVLRAIQKARFRVPDDIRVIGFDDIIISKYVGLTTLRQPMYEMGVAAIEKLLARIEDPERSTTHTVFSPTLIKRRTTEGIEGDTDPIIEEVFVT